MAHDRTRTPLSADFSGSSRRIRAVPIPSRSLGTSATKTTMQRLESLLHTPRRVMPNDRDKRHCHRKVPVSAADSDNFVKLMASITEEFARFRSIPAVRIWFLLAKVSSQVGFSRVKSIRRIVVCKVFKWPR